MAWVRRQWTPAAADHWSREDWIAATLSTLSYLLLILGSAFALLARPAGYVLLGMWAGVTAAMYFVIDPKLRAVSSDYEKKQAAYLERVEKITRWEERE